MTGQTPDQATATSVTAEPQPSGTASQEITVEITSTPLKADIEVDGTFMGNTPSSVNLAPGEHTIKVSKTGYAPWERKVKITGGNVKISPELEPLAPASGSKE
jgi:hypothetical protein